jgi:hypothetical protein
MPVTEFRMEVENKPGQLAAVIKHLGYEGVNLRGILVAEEQNRAVIRLVTADPVKAQRVLKEAEVEFTTEKALAVEIPDRPGALYKVTGVLANEDINIDYVYPLLGRDPNAVLVIGTSQLEPAEKVLTSAGIGLLADEDLM